MAHIKYRQGKSSQTEVKNGRLGSEKSESKSDRDALVYSRQKVGYKTNLLKRHLLIVFKKNETKSTKIYRLNRSNQCQNESASA